MGRSILEWENELSGVKDITRQKLKEIADAIRAKDGTAALMYPTDMPKRILALPQGADTSGVSITWGDSSIAVILGAINDAISYKEGTAPGNVTPGVANDFASRILALKTPSRLPEGYTEVAYISPLNSASQINTGIPLLTSGGSIEMDVEVTVSTLGAYYWYPFMCYRVTSSKYYGVAVRLYNKNTVAARAFNANTVSSETVSVFSLGTVAFPASLNIKFNMSEQTSTQRIFWINGVKKTVAPYSAVPTLSTTYAIIGGGGIPTNTAYARSEGAIRVKRAVINGHELVPCKNVNGNAGLYDLTAQAFKTAVSSSYKWAAGPEV